MLNRLLIVSDTILSRVRKASRFARREYRVGRQGVRGHGPHLVF